MLTRDEAFSLLKEYNQEPFHIRHALTVEGVMRYYARELGYGDEEEFWGIVGLLQSSIPTSTVSRARRSCASVGWTSD